MAAVPINLAFNGCLTLILSKAMETKEKTTVTVKTLIDAPKEVVWKYWTTPKDIVQWNNASDDWHTTLAEVDLRIGGKFTSRMEAKDGSEGFDFEGVYKNVVINERIDYIIGDGRRVKILFITEDNKTKVVESFELENTNPIEMQQNGWQAILDNFKSYVESNYLRNK
jgi:uncharacterized protein YndB with AHSA1/START domain